MKRPIRIVLEILGPPVLGLLPFYVMMTPDLVADIAYGHVNPEEHLAIICGAYIVSGVPSIIYALVMEAAFSRFLSPSSWRAVMLSATLGLVSGVLIGAVMNSLDSGRDGELHSIRTMLPLGLVVGFVMGLLVKVLSKKEPNQPSEPTPPSVTDRADARSAPAGGVAHL